MLQVSNEDEIIKMVEDVLEQNQKMVEDYKNADEGRKPRVLKGLMGQVMKLSKGKANPELVNKILIEKLYAFTFIKKEWKSWKKLKY